MRNIKQILDYYFKNTYPESIQKEFLVWFQQENNGIEKEQALYDIWNKHIVVPDKETHKAFRKVLTKTGIRSTFNKWKLIASVASVLLIVCLSSLIYIWNKPIEYQNIYLADKACKIELSDGTIVRLSKNSQLICPEKFSIKSRKVSLQGEAYFEVTKNNGQVFMVETKDQTIKVLGTQFNVRAYPTENYIETTLVEGIVELSYPKLQSVTMSVGEQVKYEINNNKLNTTSVDVELLKGWKTGKYIFRNRPFTDILQSLEKGFGVKIILERKDLEKKIYNMQFVHGESLETILDLIKINAKYNYRYKQGSIIIY